MWVWVCWVDAYNALELLTVVWTTSDDVMDVTHFVSFKVWNHFSMRGLGGCCSMVADKVLVLVSFSGLGSVAASEDAELLSVVVVDDEEESLSLVEMGIFP